MQTDTRNEIRREMILCAPRERVWEALTTPEGWTGWFSQRVEGKFQPGETLTLDFGSYGLCWGVVVERVECESFAYRWHPGEDCAIDKYPESEMTTVRFTLEDAPGGTKLTLVESGFENLPTSRQPHAREMNSEGWTEELGELTLFVETGRRQENNTAAITRERTVHAPIERVWEAIATSEGLCQWFVQSVLGEFKPGTISTWTFPSGTQGEVLTVEIEEPTRFVIRWHPGEQESSVFTKYPESQATTTTFTLERCEEGTKLRLVESGFENIPEPRREKSRKSNSEGWTTVIDWLKDHLEKTA